MKNTAYMITRKEDNFNGIIKKLDENRVVILWEDESEEQLTNLELKDFVNSDDYDLEEVELTEDTPAQSSIQAHSSPDATTSGEADGNPKTKFEYMKAILGNLADMDMESLVKYYNDQQAMVGGEGDRAGLGNAVKGNQRSIDMKPSGAEGRGPWNGMESVLPKLQKEEQDAIFSESELTEEAKIKMTTLFETAVSARLVEEIVKIEESYEVKLNEAIEKVSSTMIENLNDYLDHVANEWIKENQIAIESTLRTEITNDFINGLKGLFNEHYIDIPEDKVDILETVVMENESLKETLNKKINESIEIQKTINNLKKDNIVSEASVGLTITQREKLKKLSETIEFKDEKSFKENLSVVKKGFINEKNSNSNIVTESIEVKETKTNNGDATIAAMASTIF